MIELAGKVNEGMELPCKNGIRRALTFTLFTRDWTYFDKTFKVRTRVTTKRECTRGICLADETWTAAKAIRALRRALQTTITLC